MASIENPSPDPIEVERQYSAEDGVDVIAARVLALGGSEIGSVSFTDTYYDTPSCALTARDVWLRKRDDTWELKIPILGDDRRSGGERSVFREVRGASGVSFALGEILGFEADDVDESVCDTDTKGDGFQETRGGSLETAGPASDSKRLERALTRRNLSPFASFQTFRSKFKLRGASVDVDAASFGHTVVEVEVLCAHTRDVPKAEELVDSVASALALKDIGATGGKLETYIRRRCPEQLATLVENGILKER